MEHSEVRHLPGVKSNFGIVDRKVCLLYSVSHENRPLSHAIITYAKALVQAQCFLFDTLWNNAIPAQEKIREIEERCKANIYWNRSSKRFVLDGAYVFIIDRNKKELDFALSDIGKNIVGIEGDVSNLADLDKLFSTVKDKKGQLDILFANAGIIRYVPLVEISQDDFYN